MRIQRQARRRAGATTVEFAFVAILLFMLVFAIFEYGRYLFVYHMATNAARDAARFACVHTSGGTMPGEPAAITTANVVGVWQTGMFNGQQYGTGMCGMENQITGWTVNVFAVTDTNLYASPPDLTPGHGVAWTSAAFHQQIAVQVTGTYQPIVPSLIGLNSSVPFSVTVLMGSEAN